MRQVTRVSIRKGASGSELRVVGGGEGEETGRAKPGGMGRSSRDFTPVVAVLRTSDLSTVRGENGGEDGEAGGGEGEEEGRGVGGRFEGGWWMSAIITLELLD